MVHLEFLTTNDVVMACYIDTTRKVIQISHSDNINVDVLACLVSMPWRGLLGACRVVSFPIGRVPEHIGGHHRSGSESPHPRFHQVEHTPEGSNGGPQATQHGNMVYPC